MPENLNPQDQWDTQFEVPLPGEPRNIGPLRTLFQRLLNRTERLKNRIGEVLGLPWDAALPDTLAGLHGRLNSHKTAPVLDHPDGSVVTAKLADGAVTASKLAANHAPKSQGSISFGAANWDQLTEAGYYLVSPGGSGGSGAPPASSQSGLLIVERSLDGPIVQRFLPASEPHSYWRIRSDAWGQWIRQQGGGFAQAVDPIAYYNQTGQNYDLRPGEVAVVNFNGGSNGADVHTRIATNNGRAYWIFVISEVNWGTVWSGGSWPVNWPLLRPNGTVYSQQFSEQVVVVRETSTAGFFNENHSGFPISAYYGSSIGLLHTGLPGSRFFLRFSEEHPFGSNNNLIQLAPAIIIWRNNTTPWTYLGSLSVPPTVAGKLIVLRIF